MLLFPIPLARNKDPETIHIGSAACTMILQVYNLLFVKPVKIYNKYQQLDEKADKLFLNITCQRNLTPLSTRDRYARI